jgi:hypothetical protein
MPRNNVLWLHVLSRKPDGEPSYVLQRMTVETPSIDIDWQGRRIRVAVDAAGRPLEVK